SPRCARVRIAASGVPAWERKIASSKAVFPDPLSPTTTLIVPKSSTNNSRKHRKFLIFNESIMGITPVGVADFFLGFLVRTDSIEKVLWCVIGNNVKY